MTERNELVTFVFINTLLQNWICFFLQIKVTHSKMSLRFWCCITTKNYYIFRRDSYFRNFIDGFGLTQPVFQHEVAIIWYISTPITVKFIAFGQWPINAASNTQILVVVDDRICTLSDVFDIRKTKMTFIYRYLKNI